MLFDLSVLFIAGLLGGVINSVAGGGSFITFPALLFVGVPPVSANATNTFASCAGYLSGTYAFKDSLKPYMPQLPKVIVLSLLGGIAGAYFLLTIPPETFKAAIPWLVLLATVLFAFGSRVNQYLEIISSVHPHGASFIALLLPALLVFVGAYGGFFNAGLGIIALSYLVLAGYTDINAMNGMKLVISSIVSLTAIVFFLLSDLIAWQEGMAVLIGSVFGGYIAALTSKKLSQNSVKTFVLLLSSGITIYFFIDTYAI